MFSFCPAPPTEGYVTVLLCSTSPDIRHALKKQNSEGNRSVIIYAYVMFSLCPTALKYIYVKLCYSSLCPFLPHSLIKNVVQKAVKAIHVITYDCIKFSLRPAPQTERYVSPCFSVLPPPAHPSSIQDTRLKNSEGNRSALSFQFNLIYGAL